MPPVHEICFDQQQQLSGACTCCWAINFGTDRHVQTKVSESKTNHVVVHTRAHKMAYYTGGTLHTRSLLLLTRTPLCFYAPSAALFNAAHFVLNKRVYIKSAVSVW